MDWSTLVMLLRKSPSIITSLMVGGVVVGLPLAVVGYFLSYQAVEGYQKKLKEKLRLQKEKLKQKVAQKTHRPSSQRKRKNSNVGGTEQITKKDP
jgi:hypothetical protein